MTAVYTKQAIGYVRMRVSMARRVFVRVGGTEYDLQTTREFARRWLEELAAGGWTQLAFCEFHEPRVGWCVAISLRLADCAEG
jgi:hypothetical protein